MSWHLRPCLLWPKPKYFKQTRDLFLTWSSVFLCLNLNRSWVKQKRNWNVNLQHEEMWSLNRYVVCRILHCQTFNQSGCKGHITLSSMNIVHGSWAIKICLIASVYAITGLLLAMLLHSQILAINMLSKMLWWLKLLLQLELSFKSRLVYNP